MEMEKTLDSFEHNGLSGIKKRVDSIDGEMELYSAPGKGMNILILIPNRMKQNDSMLFEVFK